MLNTINMGSQGIDKSNERTKILVRVEQIQFNKTQKMLQEQMLAYYKEMEALGCFKKKETDFLKQGIIFKYLKLFHFNMRPDELNEKEHFMKIGDFSRVRRSISEDSDKSNDSKKSNGYSKIRFEEAKQTGSPSKKAELRDSKKPCQKQQYKFEGVSPTRRLIRDFEDRICEFDINKVLEWNAENIRKYKVYIERFSNPDVMLNLMLLDKQLQDLKSNYKLVREMRDSDTDFYKLVDSLKVNYEIINKRHDRQMRRINGKVRDFAASNDKLDTERNK